MVRYESPGAPARVVYNRTHPMPWGWRVSSYFLTKGISAGIAIVLALFLLAGGDPTSTWARVGAPLVAGLLLAATGALLVWDLKRPDRFIYLLTKGNPSSWLVRGAWILTAYAAVLGLWFVLGIAEATDALRIVIWIAAVIGLALAGYTAFLFGQAEARDLWQSPTLLWHTLAGAVTAGGGVTVILGSADTTLRTVSAWAMVGGAAALGMITLVELTSRHPTRNIAEAVHHMTRGRYSREWWLGGQLVGVATPIALGAVFLAGGSLGFAGLGGLAAMAGIWFADDAFVKAGQSVPLS